MNETMSVAFFTHRGQRLRNEDSLLVLGRVVTGDMDDVEFVSFEVTDDLTAVLAVADGLGGHLGGQWASAYALNRMMTIQASGEYKGNLSGLICKVHQSFFEPDALDSAQSGGTTIAALCIRGGEWIACNVGDSRIYSCNENIEQVSTDDIVVAYGRKLLSHSIGRTHGLHAPSVHVRQLRPESTEKVLICNDGVTAVVVDSELEDCLKEKTATDSAKRLTHLCKSRFTQDNFSIIVVSR